MNYTGQFLDLETLQMAKEDKKDFNAMLHNNKDMPKRVNQRLHQQINKRKIFIV